MLYVEELIGPNTVNTVPPATLDAFRDHGKPRDSLEENIEDARRVLEELEKVRHLARRHHGRTGQGRRQAVCGCRRQALRRGRAASARPSLGGGIDRQQLALGDGIRQGGREEHRGLARVGDNPPPVAEGQIGLDR